MKIIKYAYELQYSLQYLRKKYTIGFVPTMGYLHEGHLSLIEQAKKDNDIVVVSIFVNPLQFGENEDFDQYPRDEARDIELAKNTGADFLFMPDAKEMYPDDQQITMHVGNRAEVLCGKSRPNHFDGVVTVVSKLFHIVTPHQAYFGLKDAQQFAIIEALVRDLNFPVGLIGLPTIREQDGLAKSSRNVYLTAEERKEAVWISRALQQAQEAFKSGVLNTDAIKAKMRQIIENETNGMIDYIEILSYPKLRAMEQLNGQIIIAVAVFFDKTRLIDNIILDQHGNAVTMITV
ncbi:pantoate--beta-alanine ligase [Ornithinibacillus sp. 4-3]|uniref:Pantothenate synthetase n=1 Tax=Ornithinibacillus sp. 4-3 TaxID=3231488 RepID=A0AB39HGN4_9BACI